MVSSVSIENLGDVSAAHTRLIDVRSAAEFAIGHIPRAVNVPMEQVDARLADIGDGPVVLVCEAGTRATVVAGWLSDRQRVSVLSGGTAAWRKAGLPLVACAPSRWSLERQVRFAAGLIVLTATLLAAFFHPQVALRGDVRWRRADLCRSYEHLRNGNPASPHAVEPRAESESVKRHSR